MAIPCDRKALDQAAYIENPKTAGDVDRRVHDVCANEKLDTLIGLSGGTSGTPFFLDAQTVTTPGITQVIVTTVVAVGKTLKLKKVRLSCRREVSYNIFIGATIVGSGRVGSGNLNDDFVFEIERDASAGSTVKVEILANSGAASDVECYLQATEV